MNESRQTVETDTLWLSNICALNFRKPGHLRKYCNNENFPIYGICIETFVHKTSILFELYGHMYSHYNVLPEAIFVVYINFLGGTYLQ